jgi:hypothetical protein
VRRKRCGELRGRAQAEGGPRGGGKGRGGGGGGGGGGERGEKGGEELLLQEQEAGNGASALCGNGASAPRARAARANALTSVTVVCCARSLIQAQVLEAQA